MENWKSQSTTSFFPVRIVDGQVVHRSGPKELIEALSQVFHVDIYQKQSETAIIKWLNEKKDRLWSLEKTFWLIKEQFDVFGKRFSEEE